MTLNMTIISPMSIHQSADFRISGTARDADGNWIEMQPNSSKIVSLRYEDWSGLLTYCGIGSWNGRRTDEYAVAWLSELPDARATFHAVIEKIRQRGTDWIKTINAALATRSRHSFAIAAYEGGTPRYAIISNCETWSQQIPIADELLIDSRRSTNGIHVFVTGIRRAVPESAKRKLKFLIRSGAAQNVIRYELAAINRMAAQSPRSNKGISEACLAYSLDVHGGGGGEVHGEVPGPLMPKTVFAGTEITKLLAPLLAANPAAKLVQAAFATSASSDAAGQEHINCKIHVNEARPSPDAAALANIEEVGAVNEYWLSMHALNEGGNTVGQLRSPLQAAPQACVWEGEEINALGTFGGPFSNALSINDKGQVVGTAHVDNAATHAFLWQRDHGMQDLGTLGGRDSVARAINNDGRIVGNSFADAGEPKHDGERAFLWTPEGGMVNLGLELGGWSQAVAINNEGVVLGWRTLAGVTCGFIWSPEFGDIDIAGLAGRAFFPCSINESGLVVGEGDDSLGKRCALAWTREHGLAKLNAPDDFHPSDIDSAGNVLGNVHSRPWSRPYLYLSSSKEFVALPFVEDHHTSVKAFNNAGLIVGSAWTSSWKHTHPLIWRLAVGPP